MYGLHSTEWHRAGRRESPITREWLAHNNELAKRIPRGRSTPDSRLALAVAEYEQMSRTAINVSSRASSGDAQDALGPEFREAALRSRGSDSGGRHEEEGFGRWTQAAYGAGRAYERAIQEARFGRMYGNAECLQQSGAWLEANR